VFTSYVNEWYSGNLQKLFFHKPENPEVKKKIKIANRYVPYR